MSSFTVIHHVPWILFISSAAQESKFKKWENEDDLNPFLNGTNVMWNGIIVPMLLVMAFLKITHQKTYLSINKV